MLSNLSKKQISMVKTALQEDDGRFKHYLQLLENWMNCHSFIPQNYDTRMLPIYLRSCKYNLEKTKNKLEMYFVYKKRYPEMFCYNYFNEHEQKALENVYLYESSNITPEGYRVGWLGFRSPNTTGCDMSAVIKLLSMFATYKANLDQINAGLIMVVNLDNFSPAIAAGVLIPSLKRLLDMVQKVYPFRVRGIYITALPLFAVPIANMVKMLFNVKIRNRMFVEAGDEQMKKSIPNNCLPKEFGGADGAIDGNSTQFLKHLESAKSWFLQQEKIQIVREIPKELYATSGIDDDAGTQGSFRKLDID